MKKFIAAGIISVGGLMVFASSLRAQEISTSTTTPQTISSTTPLTVDMGVTLNVSGTSGHGKVAVNFADSTNGDTLTVNNNGTIEQSGTVAGNNSGRAMVDSNGHDTIIINNNAGATIEAADADVIHMSQGSNSVTVNNSGTINAMNVSTGTSTQALDLNGITSGTTTVNNYTGGVIEASDGDAIDPGVGTTNDINNDGTIESTHTSGNTTHVDAINAGSSTGDIIVNGAAIMGDTASNALIEGAHHGITGGNTSGTGSYTMSITNNAGATIQGDDGSGINIDGIGVAGTGSGTLITNESVTVTNSGTITGNGVTGDGDAVDVDGDVTIMNHGKIISENAVSATPGQVEFSEGVTVGGGSITNFQGATIEGEETGTSGVGRGITLAGVDHDANDNGIPIQSIYENSSITNSGLVKGDGESGITVLGTTGGGYSVTILNNPTGTIEGNNSGAAEDQTISGGPDNGQASGQTHNQAVIELDDTGDTYSVTNSGTITQDNTTNGTAVAMHGSSNTLTVSGGSAVITGNVSGDTAADSTLTINPGAGGSFNYGYQISNFTVQINSDGMSGTVTLSGTNTYSGGTTIQGGKLLVENTTAGTSGTGTGSISNTGGVLGGFGIINPQNSSLVSVTSGGTLAPGTAGHTNSMTLDATSHSTSSAALSITGATLTFNLNTVMGTNSASSLSLTNVYAGEVASLDNDTFNFNDLSSGHLGLGFYNLIVVSGSTTDPFAGLTNATITGLSGYAGSIQISTLMGGNYAVQLDITSVATPEPDTWAIIIAGGLGLMVAIRLRRNAAAQAQA